MTKKYKETIHELSGMIYYRDREIENLKEDLEELKCHIYNCTPNRTERDVKENVFEQMDLFIDKQDEQIAELRLALAEASLYWSEKNRDDIYEMIYEPTYETIKKWQELAGDKAIKQADEDWLNDADE